MRGDVGGAARSDARRGDPGLLMDIRIVCTDGVASGCIGSCTTRFGATTAGRKRGRATGLGSCAWNCERNNQAAAR
eukprot:COSAG01_NODE_10414_length_2172_cov_1.498312_3_plen_75_part_01